MCQYLGVGGTKKGIATADIQSLAMHIQIRPENTKRKERKKEKERSKRKKFQI